jgi:leader peptidase (prepilin peptidase) / N-methyltransferase
VPESLESLEILTRSPLGYGLAIALGLLWGSFANVCIYRWPPSEAFPHGRSVVRPGSHCAACQAPIRWYDNVPILAWLWLRGRCRACKAAFSPRYLIVEAATGALFGVAWWAAVVAPALFAPPGQRLLHFALYAAFCFVMVVITFIDLDHKLILNKVTLPSIALFYAATLVLPERRWFDGVVGAAVGYGLPWLIGEIYFRLTKREGLGLGDGMLLALIGALLGWRGVLVSLFGGSMIGSVIGIAALIAVRRDDEPAGGGGPEGEAPPSLMRTELPFGPFLAMAAILYLFAEPWVELHFHLPGG